MSNDPTLSDIIAATLPSYAKNHSLSPHQWQVCHHILDCRTEILGGALMRCDQCGHEAPWYLACRDRHCPGCQQHASDAWCEQQKASVLPVTYYHLIVSLPHELNPWIALHDRECYNLLFESVWSTLKAFGADPKRLKGQIGMTAVLHTWGQTLNRHVHLHCLIPGGGLTADGSWIPAKSTYLFPVRALSVHIRGGYVSRLRQAIKASQLPRLTDPKAIDERLDSLMNKDWNVYTKPCITYLDTVIDYLGRYTHRTALSHARLLRFENDQVDLRYKDYRDEQYKVMTLSSEELLHRFLLHVLPKGYMRVRHYGLLANRHRKEKIEQIRSILSTQKQQLEPTESTQINDGRLLNDTPNSSPFDDMPCPKCRQGHLHPVAVFGKNGRFLIPYLTEGARHLN